MLGVSSLPASGRQTDHSDRDMQQEQPETEHAETTHDAERTDVTLDVETAAAALETETVELDTDQQEGEPVVVTTTAHTSERRGDRDGIGDAPTDERQTDLRLSIPPPADDAEVAAIVAAIAAHIEEERRTAVEGDRQESTVDAWTISGRYPTDRAVRTPPSLASLDAWTLSWRTHTFRR